MIVVGSIALKVFLTCLMFLVVECGIARLYSGEAEDLPDWLAFAAFATVVIGAASLIISLLVMVWA